MAEEKSRNSISDTTGVVVFAVLMGLAALFLCVWLFTSRGDSKPDDGDESGSAGSTSIAVSVPGFNRGKKDESAVIFDEISREAEEAKRKAAVAADAVAKLESEKARSIEKSGALESRNSVLETQLESARKERNSLAADRDTATRERVDLDGQLNRLRQESEAARKSLEQAKKSESVSVVLKKRVVDLEKNLSNLKKENLALSQQVQKAAGGKSGSDG